MVKEPVLVETTVVNSVVSNLIVIDALVAKLVPETVTLVLGGPEVGETVTPLDIPLVTVNVADAVIGGLLLSVAVTVRPPTAALLGIVMVAVKEPVFEEVTVVGLVVIGLLSNFIVIVLLAPKLEPEIVTIVPVGPEVGDKVIAVCGAVTVNVTVLELCSPSLATRV